MMCTVGMISETVQDRTFGLLSDEPSKLYQRIQKEN